MRNPSQELNKLLLEIDKRAESGDLYSDKIGSLSFILGAASLLSEDIVFEVALSGLSEDFKKTMLASTLYAIQSAVSRTGPEVS